MIGALFRSVRNLLYSIVGLAGLIAMVEVGVRIADLYEAQQHPQATAISGLPVWQRPSSTTGWEVPRSAKLSFPESAGNVTWQTNSWGLRGPEPVVPKPAAVYRVLCLGDETILGASLPDADIFATHLQRQLQGRSSVGVEVLTGSVPQACPLTLAIAYRLQWQPLQPDLILLHLSDRSLVEDQAVRSWTLLDPDGQPLVCRHPDFRVASAPNLASACRQQFTLVDRAFRLWAESEPAKLSTRSWSSRNPPDSSDLRMVVGPVDTLHGWSRAAGARLVVWLSPTQSESAADYDAFANQSMKLLTEWQIPGVDLEHVAGRQPGDGTSTWTAAAHEAHASALSQQLLQNLPGPWMATGPATTSAPPVRASDVPHIQRANR